MTEFGGTQSATSPLPQQQTTLSRTEAEELGQQLQSLAANQAQLEHDFCQLVERFDSGDALAHFHGIKSTAHFLAWACSMGAGTAREHVRVARALQQMPRVDELFRQGRLSYSKVRELTRIAGMVDEEALCELALEMTASQVARTVATYRRCEGTRLQQQSRRRFSSQQTVDGLVRLTIVLAPEEAAVITAAAEAAARKAQQAELEAKRGETDADILALVEDVPAGTPPSPPDRVQGMVDVAANYLDAQPGEPDDDHTLVMVLVSAEQLEPGAAARPADLRQGVCHVEGHGAIEPATAQRLACTARLLPALVDSSGDVLRLGRARRLATRAQRRALRIRDKGICQFPGCHQRWHLDAHHIVGWSAGGPTDLENLVLLCRRHHVQVHEGGLQLRLVSEPRRHLEVSMANGRPITGTWLEDLSAAALESHLLPAIRDARIFPSSAGRGFSMNECIKVLQNNTLGTQGCSQVSRTSSATSAELAATSPGPM